MTITTITIDELRTIIENRKTRSAWDRGVTAYALDLLDDLDGYGYRELYGLATPDGRTLSAVMLNGASDWNQYSWGGSSLIYDSDIAERVCTPSELKRTRNGERRPNSREEWLDVQARALNQAARVILRTVRRATYKEV